MGKLISVKDYENAPKPRQGGKQNLEFAILFKYLEAKYLGLEYFELPEIKFAELSLKE